MKLQPHTKRNIGFLFLIVLVGTILGTIFSQFVGFIVPEGIVKEFFLASKIVGWNPVTFNLQVLSFTLGISLEISVVSILGIAIAWYFLRYFK